MELLVGVHNKQEYVNGLIEILLSTASELESGMYGYKVLNVVSNSCTHEFQDIPFQDPKFLLVDIVSKSERCAGDRDGYHVDMKITNKFPCVGESVLSLRMYLTTK